MLARGCAAVPRARSLQLPEHVLPGGHGTALAVLAELQLSGCLCHPAVPPHGVRLRKPGSPDVLQRFRGGGEWLRQADGSRYGDDRAAGRLRAVKRRATTAGGGGRDSFGETSGFDGRRQAGAALRYPLRTNSRALTATAHCHHGESARTR